jgi:hypothetical protein
VFSCFNSLTFCFKPLFSFVIALFYFVVIVNGNFDVVSVVDVAAAVMVAIEPVVIVVVVTFVAISVNFTVTV